MSEPVGTAAAANSGAQVDAAMTAGLASDAPTTTAGADPTPPAPPVNPTAVVNSVVQTVSSHPDVQPSKAAGIAAAILASLYQAQPAIFAVTRSSPKTQAEVGFGLGLAEIILGAFLHPAG